MSAAGLRNALTAVAWGCRGVNVVPPRSPVVLVYHGVPKHADEAGMNGAALERQLLFLKTHFDFVSAKDPAGRDSGQARILLTFDDGFRNNAEVVAPVLRRHRIPALFFVATRHVVRGRYLWFSYLRMLQRFYRASGFHVQGEFMDMSPGRRAETVRRLEALLLGMKPHPAAMYRVIDNELPALEDFMDETELHDNCAGMTEDQIGEISRDPLFAVGGHTEDHPLLTRCTADEALRQMQTNKERLERICGSVCDTFAYPGADYNRDIVMQCRSLGFRRAYTVERGFGTDADLEVHRVGIYYPTVTEAATKVRWSSAIIRLRQFQAMLAS